MRAPHLDAARRWPWGERPPRPGPPYIAEHYRFAEENPAHSRVFFRKKVNFRVLAGPGGAGGAHGATVTYLRIATVSQNHAIPGAPGSGTSRARGRKLSRLGPALVEGTVLAGGATEGSQRAELVEGARVRRVERSRPSLGAEGPVADLAVQGELTQVRHVRLLVVDEQAGGTVVADRNRELVGRDVRAGIERHDPGEFAVQEGDRHAVGTGRPRAVAEGDGHGRAADVPPQQPAVAGDGQQQAGRRVLAQFLAAHPLIERPAGQVDIDGGPAADQATAG